jgi:SagB-type dehydrogenase family enzyme
MINNSSLTQFELMELVHESTRRSPLGVYTEMSAIQKVEPEIAPNPAQLFPLPVEHSQLSTPIEQLVLRRRTCHRFQPTTPITLSDLAKLLAIGTVKPTQDEPTVQNRLYVLANRVDGIPFGSYYYHPAPGAPALVRVNGGVSSTQLLDLLAQPEVADAAVVIVMAGALNQALATYGNRGYRYLLQAAGTSLENLYLAATEANIGCRPSGRWQAVTLERHLGMIAQREISLLTLGLGLAL